MDPRILPNSEISYSKKDWQNTELTHYLLARLKHHNDHRMCILNTIFACKSYICVRQKHITPKRITLSQCFCVGLFVVFHVEIKRQYDNLMWRLFTLCGFTKPHIFLIHLSVIINFYRSCTTMCR